MFVRFEFGHLLVALCAWLSALLHTAIAGSMHCLVVRPGYGLVSEKCPAKTVACRIKISHDAVEYYEYSALYDRNQFACVLKNEFGNMDKSGCVKNQRGRVRCWCYGRSNCNTPEDSKKLYEAFTSGDKRRLNTVIEEIDFSEVEDDYEENPGEQTEPTTTVKSTTSAETGKDKLAHMRRLPKPSTTESSHEVVEKGNGEKIYKIPIVSRDNGGVPQKEKPDRDAPHKSNSLAEVAGKRLPADGGGSRRSKPVASFAANENGQTVGRHHRLRKPSILEPLTDSPATTRKPTVKKLGDGEKAARLPTDQPPSSQSSESSTEQLTGVVLKKKIQRGAALGGEDEGVQVIHVNSKDKYYVSQVEDAKPSDARVLPTDIPAEHRDNLPEDEDDEEEDDVDSVIATTSRQDAYLESSFLSGRSKVDVVQIQPRDQELEEYFDNAFYAASNASGSILGLAGAIGSVSLLVVIAQIVL